MRKIRLACWNVNGLRAAARKGFFEWLSSSSPDIVGIQEAKLGRDNIPEELKSPPGYSSFFSLAERKGYSGVGLYSKLRPHAVHHGMGIERFDSEGRYVRADFEEFSLLNVYFPNGKAGSERLAYKMDFYEHFLIHVEGLRKEGKKLVICGDVNTAHKPIDLARPKENEGISGFLPEERAWMDKFLSSGFVDAFRHFNKDPRRYSWWSMRTAARERNVGWRIDYFFVSEDLLENLSAAELHPEVYGSDHCPISLDLRF